MWCLSLAFQGESDPEGRVRCVNEKCPNAQEECSAAAQTEKDCQTLTDSQATTVQPQQPLTQEQQQAIVEKKPDNAVTIQQPPQQEQQEKESTTEKKIASGTAAAQLDLATTIELATTAATA